MNLTKHWAAQLDDYVIDLAWSPAAGLGTPGALLAAASAAGPVHLFAAADGTKQHELPGHENGTNCLAWQPVGQKPDVRSQMSVSNSGLTSDPRSLASGIGPLASGPTLATGGQDGAVKLWDAATGQHTATAQLGTAWVEHLAWRPAQKSDVSGQKSDQTGSPSPSDLSPLTSDLRPLTSGSLLAAAAGRQLTFLRADASVAHTCPPTPKTIGALAWQPAGGCLAAAHFGGVRLWDADDFLLQKELPYANGILALVWSPDNRWLVSGNQDPSVHLWIPEKNEELHMSGYEAKVAELAFDHTSHWLATGGGPEACIWDCTGAGPEGREPVMLPHDTRVSAVAFQHAHGLLATASADGTVFLWSPERKQPLRAKVRLPVAATKLAWSPEDALLAIGAQNGAVYVLKCEA